MSCVESMMRANYASEGAPPHKKRRNEKASPSWSSLPDEVALSIVARLTRLDHAALSLVSKRHRSLVASPELCRTRSLIAGCREAYQYVCLNIRPAPNPSWFILTRTRQLWPIPSNPYQPLKSSAFVVLDWGIYVIGGMINGNPTRDVWFLDCFSHTWRQVPSMKMARASASANVIDGKIYVFGGCGDDANCAEVFDPRTQTWLNFISPMMPNSIHQSVVVRGKKIYAVDEEDRSFCYLPSECQSWTSGKSDCKVPGNRSDWCAIGNLLFCRGTRGRILWCEPEELDWKEVKGLEELQGYLDGFRHVLEFSKIDYKPCKPTKTKVRYDISKLCCCTSSGNLLIFWNTQPEYPAEGLELRSAEISLDRHDDETEIWGTCICCLCDCISREDKGFPLTLCPVKAMKIHGFQGTMNEVAMIYIDQLLDYFPSLKEMVVYADENNPRQLRNREVSKLVSKILPTLQQVIELQCQTHHCGRYEKKNKTIS